VGRGLPQPMKGSATETNEMLLYNLYLSIIKLLLAKKITVTYKMMILQQGYAIIFLKINIFFTCFYVVV